MNLRSTDGVRDDRDIKSSLSHALRELGFLLEILVLHEIATRQWMCFLMKLLMQVAVPLLKHHEYHCSSFPRLGRIDWGVSLDHHQKVNGEQHRKVVLT